MIRKNCDICGERLSQTEDAYKLHRDRFHPSKLKLKPLDGPKCNICVAVFGSWEEHSRHSRQVHGMFDKKIVPVKTTTRSKAQIVMDMEKSWGAAIIPEVKPWHSLA